MAIAVQRLPEETLCKIFTLATPTSYPTSSELDPSVFDSVSPNNVSLVCRRWRQIAIADPSLWSTIYLSLRYPTEDELRKAILILDRYLARSRDMPLSCFIITTIIRRNQSSINLAGLLFCSLLEQQSRWKSIDIRIPGAFADFVGELQGLPYFILYSDYLPSLESLCVNVTQMFHISGPAPLSSLTSLELCSASCSGAIDWLTRSPNLEKLVLESEDGWIIPDESRPIMLGNLRTLSFNAPFPGLQLLDCPALEDLTITWQDWNLPHFQNFVAQYPLLRALRIEDIPPMSTPALREFLQASKLKTLSLSYQDTSRHPELFLFRFLSRRRTEPLMENLGGFELAHELEHLEVSRMFSTFKGALDFVVARWNTEERKLKSVKLKQCVDYQRGQSFAEMVADRTALPDAWEQVKKFIREGLVLGIS